MPEWNLVAERQKLFLILTPISLVGAIVLFTGCSKLPGLQDYESTEYGAFESRVNPQPPTNGQREISQAKIEQQGKIEQQARIEQARNEAKKQQASDAILPTTDSIDSTLSALRETDAIPQNEVRNNQVRKIQAVQNASNRSEELDGEVRTTSFDSQVLEQLVTPFDPQVDQVSISSAEPESAPAQVAETVIEKDVTLVARVGEEMAAPVNTARNGEMNFDRRPEAILPNAKSEYPPIQLVNQTSATRPTSNELNQVEAVAPGVDADVFARINERIPEARRPSQPLRPMLFNEKTRELNAQYDKTLREPVERATLERDVVLDAKTPTSSQLPQNAVTSMAGQITPGERGAERSHLASQSRALRPIDNQWDWVDGDSTDSVAVDASAFSNLRISTPVSEPVVRDEIPPFAQPPMMDTDNQTAFVEVPAHMIPGQVIPGEVATVREVPAEIVPVEVIEDANRLIEASFDEIEQFATEGANEFPVRTASSFDSASDLPPNASSTCEMCNGFTMPGGAECPSCSEGKPLAHNNEFAVSDVPVASEISPMVIPPSSVPGPPESQNVPTDFEAASGLPVPPKTPYNASAIETAPQYAGVSPANLAVNEDIAPSEVASEIPPVGVDALMALNTVTWQTRLDQAIHLVEKQIDASTDAEAQSGLEINLRLLQVLRRQMGNVSHSESRLTNNEQRFWDHQLGAITSMLNSETDESDVSDLLRHQTAHETLDHLRQAVEHLESIANLKVAGGQLCTEISGFGQYKVFPTKELRPDQRMLVYCEVENYDSSKHETVTGPTFRTKLRGSFAIYDEWGKAVQQAEFPIVEDVARKRRRDFYMYLPITLNDLEAGNYRLHVLVEDINANKTATLATPIDFTVR